MLAGRLLWFRVRPSKYGLISACNDAESMFGGWAELTIPISLDLHSSLVLRGSYRLRCFVYEYFSDFLGLHRRFSWSCLWEGELLIFCPFPGLQISYTAAYSAWRSRSLLSLLTLSQRSFMWGTDSITLQLPTLYIRSLVWSLLSLTRASSSFSFGFLHTLASLYFTWALMFRKSWEGFSNQEILFCSLLCVVWYTGWGT